MIVYDLVTDLRPRRRLAQMAYNLTSDRTPDWRSSFQRLVYQLWPLLDRETAFILRSMDSKPPQKQIMKSAIPKQKLNCRSLVLACNYIGYEGVRGPRHQLMLWRDQGEAPIEPDLMRLERMHKLMASALTD